jgi:hypothetical protein
MREAEKREEVTKWGERERGIEEIVEVKVAISDCRHQLVGSLTQVGR